MVAYTCYAIPLAPSWWPPKRQGASLDYSLDISAAVDPAQDFIFFAQASVAPSGLGELALSDLQMSELTLTLTTTGGQPGRIYTIKLDVTMGDGRVYEFLVYQGTPPGLRGFPTPPPPTPGFSTPIQVNRPAPSLNFSKSTNSGLRLWGWC
jgi:hypothetical protein